MGYDECMKIGIDASRAFVEEKTGVERYSSDLIEALLKLPEAKDHEWILYTKQPITNEQLRVGENVKVVSIEMPRLWTQGGLAFRTWVDRLDVLWVPAHTLPVFRKWGLKTVVTIHGVEYEYLPKFYGEWSRWHLTWSTEYAVCEATRIIAVSQFTRNELCQRLGADLSKIEVVHEGVRQEARNSKLEVQKDEILGKYGFKRNSYILFVGTVQPRKNLVRLIEAFARLGDRGLKLVVAGKLGWQYEDVLEASKKFGVANRVTFTGYINDADRYILLQNAIVYVQPSLTEGFGLPILEAMAAGVAVAAADVGAMPEIVNGKEKSAAVVFDPMNVEQIAKCLKLLVSDGGLREKIIREGYTRVKEFSWEKAARKTLKVLESV